MNLTSERVFLVTTSDPEFDPLQVMKLGCGVRELNKGPHSIYVGETKARVAEAWINPEHMPVSTLGQHALIQVIMHIVAEMHDIKMEHLCGPSRKAHIVDARRYSAYLSFDAFRTTLKHERASKSMVSTKIQLLVAHNMNRCRSDVQKLDKWVTERLDIMPDMAAMVSALKPKIVAKLPIDEQDLKVRFGEAGIQRG